MLLHQQNNAICSGQSSHNFPLILVSPLHKQSTFSSYLLEEIPLCCLSLDTTLHFLSSHLVGRSMDTHCYYKRYSLSSQHLVSYGLRLLQGHILKKSSEKMVQTLLRHAQIVIAIMIITLTKLSNLIGYQQFDFSINRVQTSYMPSHAQLNFFFFVAAHVKQKSSRKILCFNF